MEQAAVAEDIDYRHPRGLDKALFRRLLSGEWIGAHQNVLITGFTGGGKTHLACALANAACRQGKTALYQRLPRLFEELVIARGDGRHAKLMTGLGKVDVLILDEPTRGIDVGAKYEIYCIIADLAKQGKSIIMISSEMSEIIGMSNRVMVMCDGRITGFINGKDATQENIMALATQFETAPDAAAANQ